jgi:hypothetical protein
VLGEGYMCEAVGGGMVWVPCMAMGVVSVKVRVYGGGVRVWMG